MNVPAATGDISTQQKGDSFLFDATYPNKPYDHENSGRRGASVRSQIIQAVSLEFGVPVEMILGPRRYRRIAWSRQAAWWLLYRYTYASTSGLGRLFGRDHSTVVVGLAAADMRRLMPKTEDERIFSERLTRLNDRFIVTTAPKKVEA